MSLKFPITEEHKPLIDALIRMGDWLAGQELATPDQVKAIRTLQGALARLPEPTPGIDAEYGFSAVIGEGFFTLLPEDAWQGLARSWHVFMYPPCILEICSVYSPHPRVDAPEQWEHEFFMYFSLGEDNTIIDDRWNLQRFIQEISQPELLIGNGAVFEIEAIDNTTRRGAL